MCRSRAGCHNNMSKHTEGLNERKKRRGEKGQIQITDVSSPGNRKSEGSRPQRGVLGVSRRDRQMVWECQEVQGGQVPLHKSLCGDLGGRGDTLQEPESKRPESMESRGLWERGGACPEPSLTPREHPSAPQQGSESRDNTGGLLPLRETRWCLYIRSPAPPGPSTPPRTVAPGRSQGARWRVRCLQPSEGGVAWPLRFLLV